MKTTIIANTRIQGDYFKLVFSSPEMAERAAAGQSTHIRIDKRQDRILRRPFSIHDTDAASGTVTVVYKVVGRGTAALSGLAAGTGIDAMGPLGRAYTPPEPGVLPVAVAGGYGAAAMFMLTRKQPGILLMGARSAADVILTDRYRDAGYEVRVATNDGSLGKKGFVTDLIPDLLAENPGRKFFFYGCGPHPMLTALAKLLRARGLDGELSVDHVMCCGVGACFACVVKVNDPESPDGWRYARSCSEGPVFPLADVYTE
ncbi:MAG: dihydroorotate dehydrogenase electron transfer subunit [Lentisphaeria bacterium]|nr:dihydroorotate dehydrogenase electron transfer subunit [Lentisphaeria bacterium]